MKVTSCKSSGMEVSPTAYNACTFQIIDKWNPDQHAKTCDTMFYLSDGTGAYVWDCDKWIFLDFTGISQSDWAAKENEAGYIKNRPFKTLGNGLAVDENGVLNVTVKSAVTSVNGKTGTVNIDASDIPLTVDEETNVGTAIEKLNESFENLPDVVVTSVNGKTGDIVILNGKSLDEAIDFNTFKLSSENYYGVYNLKVKPSANEPDNLPTETIYQRMLEVFYGTSPYSNYIQRYSLTTSKGVTTYTRAQLDYRTWTDWVLLNSSNGGVATEANKLSTARDLKVDLTSKLAQSFDGSADADEIGVTGILPIANGGTGNAKGEAIPKTTNPNKDITDGTVNSAAKNAVLKYRILNDVIYISGSIDVVASDSNGESIKVGNVPEQYQPQKAINGVGKVHLNVGELTQTYETAQVVVVGDENTAAKGAVMFSVQSSAKLTAGTWTFFGSYNLI